MRARWESLGGDLNGGQLAVGVEGDLGFENGRVRIGVCVYFGRTSTVENWFENRAR